MASEVWESKRRGGLLRGPAKSMQTGRDPKVPPATWLFPVQLCSSRRSKATRIMSGAVGEPLATVAWGEGSGGLTSPPRGLGAADVLSFHAQYSLLHSAPPELKGTVPRG